MDWQDWKEWFKKLKWHLISFKFLSFYTVIALLVAAWLSLERMQHKTVMIAKELYKEEYIAKAAVADIIKHSQTVLFDSALNHIAVAASVVLSAIIAIKGVSYVMKSKQTSEVVKKMENGQLAKNLKRFLPSGNRDD